MNTIKSPLILKYNGHSYKVNKGGDQDGEYVDKNIAEQLLEALKKIQPLFAGRKNEYEQIINSAIKKAEEE